MPCGNGGAKITVGVAVKSVKTSDLTLLKYKIESKYNISNATVNFRIPYFPLLQFYAKLH